jgi:hypothetical protein
LDRTTGSLQTALCILLAAVVGATLLVAVLLVAGVAALEGIRLPLRKGHSAIEDRDRGDQTLRPKCNFIHKSHLVPVTAPANFN